MHRELDASILRKFYKENLSLYYVPKLWRETKVVFIYQKMENTDERILLNFICKIRTKNYKQVINSIHVNYIQRWKSFLRNVCRIAFIKIVRTHAVAENRCTSIKNIKKTKTKRSISHSHFIQTRVLACDTQETFCQSVSPYFVKTHAYKVFYQKSPLVSLSTSTHVFTIYLYRNSLQSIFNLTSRLIIWNVRF